MKTREKANTFFGIFLFICGIITVLIPFLTNLTDNMNIQKVFVSFILLISGAITGYVGLGKISNPLKKYN
jgi:succinate-acetate transporter protein